MTSVSTSTQPSTADDENHASTRPLPSRPRPFVHPPDRDPAWWRHAVIYQIYPRSWADANGDGMGDLPGITARLPYLKDLGVDALWLSPFYPSPQADAGYDVADYRDVDPRFGTLGDADALIARSHDLGLKFIVDLVPNHTSDEHVWFQEALHARRGSPERARYWFRDGLGENGEIPPNDWECVFGGAGWTRVQDTDPRTGEPVPGQWYLHLFDPKQPDLNWASPEVADEFDTTLRFWVDRGVDGFRVDVAHGMVKDPELPNWSGEQKMLANAEDPEEVLAGPMWDQDGVHDIIRRWRRVLDSYNPPGPSHDPQADRILCAEAWVHPLARGARYVRPDEMQQAFNFEYLKTPWQAANQRTAIERSLAANDSVGAPTTWVQSNHDTVRHTTRLGLSTTKTDIRGVGAGDPQPEEELGLRRARAATTMMLGLPGSAYLYQGEELGLPEHTTLPDEARQDPTWRRSVHTERGRDGARVPMPWSAHEPAYGFNTTGRSWLPQPTSYAAYAVDAEQGVAGSTLELYRAVLALRRETGLGGGEMRWVDGYGPDVVAFENLGTGTTADRICVVTNFGSDPAPLPPDADVVLASGPLTGGGLPTDTTVWLRG